MYFSSEPLASRSTSACSNSSFLEHTLELDFGELYHSSSTKDYSLLDPYELVTASRILVANFLQQTNTFDALFDDPSLRSRLTTATVYCKKARTHFGSRKAYNRCSVVSPLQKQTTQIGEPLLHQVPSPFSLSLSHAFFAQGSAQIYIIYICTIGI